MKVVKKASILFGLKKAELIFEGTLEEYEKIKDEFLHIEV